MRKVYLDNAATTALSPKVLEQMMPYLTTIYGNPSSPHSFGQEARKGVDHARDQVAKALNALQEEIIFTGCGTESDNTVLFGVAERYAKKATTSSRPMWNITRSCIPARRLKSVGLR